MRVSNGRVSSRQVGVSSCHVRVYNIAHPSSGSFKGLCPAVTGRVNGLDTTGLLDYGWSSASSDGQIRLESVINAASRLVFSACTKIRSYNTAAVYVNIPVKLSGAISIHRLHGAVLAFRCQHSFSAVVSFGRNSPCVWRRLWTTAAISIDGDSNRSSLEAQHDWRPSFSHCRGESMEHLAGRRHICAVTVGDWKLNCLSAVIRSSVSNNQ